MSSPFQGMLCSGETLGTVPIELIAAGGRLTSTDAARKVDVSLADVRASDRLAQVPRFLYLPDNRTVETPDNLAVDELLALQRRGGLVRLVHALESHARIAAVATVLLVSLTAGALWWGLPVMARRAAMAVPAKIEYQAGRAGLASFNQMLQPTQLDRKGRQRVQAQLDRLVRAGAIGAKSELEFRSMGGAFPNAFALPGGIIVVSDELVALASEDDELAAVLAHEIGHWQQRHGLQTVLRSSAALLVVCTVTGDLSTLTTFAGTIPFALLQRGYSREFEAEADAYAVQLMLKARADPRHFAAILKKLEAAQPTEGNDFSYLSTHPGTLARIDSVYATAKGLGWKNPGPLPPPAPKPMVEKNPDVSPKILLGSTIFEPTQLPLPNKSGSVTLNFIIDETGSVRDVGVVRSSDGEFEAAAIEAVSKWKFEPARKNGRAVNFLVSQTLQFEPDGKIVFSKVVPAQ